MDSWLVLRLHPLHAARAAINVERQGVEFYQPRAMMRSSRTGKLHIEPLFPGYAFARPRGEEWVFLKSTIGVSDVLTEGRESPGRIPPEYIARLVARHGSDGLVRLDSSGFAIGDRVLSDEGPLRGQLGIVEATLPHDRLRVLFSLFGRETRAVVSAEKVSRASTSSRR